MSNSVKLNTIKAATKCLNNAVEKAKASIDLLEGESTDEDTVRQLNEYIDYLNAEAVKIQVLINKFKLSVDDCPIKEGNYDLGSGAYGDEYADGEGDW